MIRRIWRGWPRWFRIVAAGVFLASLGLCWHVAALLYPAHLWIHVHTDPPGQRVWMDGRLLGVAPVAVRLPMDRRYETPSRWFYLGKFCAAAVGAPWARKLGLGNPWICAIGGAGGVAEEQRFQVWYGVFGTREFVLRAGPDVSVPIDHYLCGEGMEGLERHFRVLLIDQGAKFRGSDLTRSKNNSIMVP